MMVQRRGGFSVIQKQRDSLQYQGTNGKEMGLNARIWGERQSKIKHLAAL
jgi:hypothetical protein